MIKLHEIWPGEPTDVELMTFPGGEPHVKGRVNPVGTYLIEAHITDFNEMGRLLVLNDFIQRNVNYAPSLYLPYLPGARQDRGAPLTAKVYADLINSCGFERVIAVDPHSDVMPALLDNLKIIDQFEAFGEVIPTHPDLVTPRIPNPSNTTLVAPDAGAVKRVESFAAQGGYTQVVSAQKHRDLSTGNLTGFSCPPIPKTHPNVVVLDDICDGGGTFLGLADKIRYDDGTAPDRADLTLVVTHGIFSKGVKDLKNYFGQIITTDSFKAGHADTTRDPREKEGWPDIWVLPITNHLMKGIK